MKIRIILLLSTAVMFLSGCGGGGSNVWQAGNQTKVAVPRSEAVLVKETPKNIVLMLPLKGVLAANSQAIRNGFLAAYDHSRKDHPDLKIKVIDTTSGDIQKLYLQVVADGADVVVGPLTKKEVEEISQVASLAVPVIALNTLDDYSQRFVPNLYQFGLLPQDEAVQVATKMIAERYDHAAIIMPENSWGNKIVAAFKHKYEISGGQITATLNYRSVLNLSEQVCRFLAQDPDKLCVSQKSKNKKGSVSSKSMRRQDINAIFLVATAAQARQIVPLLKFYYAGNLPIYSTSAVYAGAALSGADLDIDGVYFCDMPWVVKDSSGLSGDLQVMHNQITSLWGSAFASHSRLYALGIDAYNLSLKLRGLLSAPQSGVEGATGVLYLDSFNHIYRELQWVQMQGGVVVALH